MLKRQPSRPICETCGELPARPNGTSSLGYTRWHRLCNRCAKKKYRPQPVKDNTCSQCGFVAQDGCQMCLVDSQTICQNCNALRVKGIQHRAELTVDATVDLGNITI